MKQRDAIGALIEAFVNRVSHRRGQALEFLNRASVTLPQVILLDIMRTTPDSTPSRLAATMKVSLPSVSQMLERLVKLGLVHRLEDPSDRRRKTVNITAKARAFLARFQVVRSAEYAAGTAALSDATRQRLADVLSQALEELAAASDAAPPSSPPSVSANTQPEKRRKR